MGAYGGMAVNPEPGIDAEGVSTESRASDKPRQPTKGK